MHGIRHFYSKIRHAMHTSFKKHVDVLPPFGKLATIPNITHLLVPSNPHYIGYTTIRSVYGWFSDSLSNLLNDTNVINKTRTPRAHQIIITHGHVDDGWDLLFILLSKLCPFLGGKTMDVASEITLLRLNNDDTIHTFFRCVQDIQTKLQYSRENIDQTRLIKFYLRAMSISKVHFPLLQNFIADLNLHITTYGPNIAHPTMTCSTIYDYLISIEAPESFQTTHQSQNNQKYKNFIKNKTKFDSALKSITPNISALEQLQELLHTNDLPYDSDTTDDQEVTTVDDDTSKLPNKYVPIIAAFKRSNNIICDACGSRGHHATKCYKRGLDFLPRDVQRRITAYNAKYGTSPVTEKSTNPHKSYHALEPPDHRTPNETSLHDTSNPSPSSRQEIPTISSLDHPIPDEDIEQILDIELGTQATATIKMMSNHDNIINQSNSNSQDDSEQSSNQCSLAYPSIINPNGSINTNNMQTLQHTKLDSYPTELLKTSRSAVFHIDSGANIHATNNIQDFSIYYPIQSDINLAVGSKAKCEGLGAIITRLTPTSSPVLLAPVYYCPSGQISTILPSALKYYNKYTDITVNINKSLDFKRYSNEPSQTLSVKVHNNLDYVGLPILHLSSDTNILPSIAKMESTNVNVQYIHQKFDHRNLSMVHKIKTINLMTGMPNKIPTFHDSYKCPICLLSKATKIPRTLHRHKDHYKPGEFSCLDFSFWNVVSIRGFSSILSAICMKTRYSFVFPTRNKRPPLSTLSWFIKTLRCQGYPVLYIQTDEGGELGRSTDFLKLLTTHNCIYMGTGKSGSSLNGVVERPNRTVANSVRSKLLNAALPDEFWCYAAEDSNFKMRRMLHTSLSTTPYEAWTGTKPTYDDMKIWGCHIYVVNTEVSRTKLSPRTYVGLFMKFSSTTKIVIYYNPKTKKFGRASHAYFNEKTIGITTNLHTQTPGTTLMSDFPSLPSDVPMSEIKSDLSTLPILQGPAVTFEIILPPVDYTCPITFYDDEVYGLPYVKSIPPNSPIGQQLPPAVLKQQWVLNIGMEEPIHAASAHDELLRLRRTHANKKIQLMLAPRVIDSNNRYENERTKFDQMRPILASASISNETSIATNTSDDPTHSSTIIPNSLHILSSDTSSVSSHLLDPAGIQVPTISVLVHSSQQPTATVNIHDCIASDNPFKSFWIQTIFEQYDKNASYRVFTRPIQRSKIPDHTLILKSVLAPTVKSTDIKPLWKLNVRHCVNGKPMKGLSSYGATHASTVSPDTVRYQLALGTSMGFRHRTYDCTNAFQCTFEDDPSKRVYCYLPPFYIKWYNTRYPHDKIDPTLGPFVLQAAQLIQGSPHAANRWQENLAMQLTSMGFIRNNVDHSFYVQYDKKGNIIAMLSVTVDDLLLS